MNLVVEHVDVWAAGLQDKPGELAGVLSALRAAGADLEFVIARRAAETPGKGLIAPVRPVRQADCKALLARYPIPKPG